MPTVFDDPAPDNANLVLKPDHESGSGTIFDLQALQVSPMGASGAQCYFRVASEMNQSLGCVGHAAAPAF